jgi:hypothetical protein
LVVAVVTAVLPLPGAVGVTAPDDAPESHLLEAWTPVYSVTYPYEEETPAAAQEEPDDSSDAPASEEAPSLDDELSDDTAYSGEHPFDAVKSASSQSPAVGSLRLSVGTPALLAAETLAIDSVEVVNGGAVQAVYRSDKVTEKDGKYYTTEKIASITDPRIFKVSVILPAVDGTGAPLLPSPPSVADLNNFLANVKWTYGEKPLSDWRKFASNSAGAAQSGNPFITLLGTNLYVSSDTYKLEAEIRFDTPLAASFGSVSTTANRAYASYPSITQSSYHPEAIDKLVGAYALAARYDEDDVLGNGGKEVQLGARDVRLSLYDSFNTWPEIDQFARDLKSLSESNGDHVNGRYVGVQSLAKDLHDGNDIWNVVIAESKDAVDEYLNVTKPLLETDPEALAAKIPGGNQKIPIYFNVIHADEVPGIDGNIQVIKSFIYDDEITFKSVDEITATNANPSSSNGYATPKSGSGVTTYSYKVDDALDKFIIVVTITSNTDGRELLLRGNEYGLDHNRQSVAQRTVESMALTSNMRKWNPVEFNEYHGYTSSMLIMPGTGPHAPYFEHDLLYPNAVEHAHTMGKAILGSTPLTSYTVPYDYWLDGWDDGGRGASYFYSYLIGSLGRTIEIPYANEDAVDAVATATKSLIYNSLIDRDELYLNKLEFARRALYNEDQKDKVDPYIVNPFKNNELVGRPRTTDENGVERKYFPDYYVIPVDSVNQYNVPEAYEAFEQLQRNGVKFRKTSEPVTVDGATYPAGTYVIDLRQYSRNFVQAALSQGYKSSYFTDTYAEVTVDLPTLRGFKVVPVWSAGLFDGTADEVDGSIARPAAAEAAGSEYVVIQTGSVDVIKLINRLFKNNKPLHIITSYTPEGKIGDFIAKRADVAEVQAGLTAVTVSFEKGAAGLADVSKPAVKPIIAAIGSPLTYSYPQGSNVTPFKWVLPDLEFDAADYSLTTALNASVIPDYNVVLDYNVNVSSTLNANAISKGIPYIGLRANGVTSAASLPNFVLGARSSSPSSAEATFKVDILPTSPISSAFAGQKAVYLNSGAFFGTLPDGTKKLITVQEGEDNFIGGWWRNATNTESGYNHALLDGKVTAIYGLAGENRDVPITLFNTDTFFRINTRLYWPLIAQSIYLGAAGIVDQPRPNAAADVTNRGWSSAPYSVALDVSASDVTGSTATVAKQLFKVNADRQEPAYSADDTAWRSLGGAVSIEAEGENYLHWYVENSEGQTHQGTYGPYYVDLTAPVVQSVSAVASGAGAAVLTALASDEHSGVASYRWQVKNNQNAWEDYAAGASVTVEGLSASDLRAFRVVVTDFAGNTAVSNAVSARAADTVAGVRTNAASHIGDAVAFTVSLQGARQVLSVSLAFVLDAANLQLGDTAVETLSGFSALPAHSGDGYVDWTPLGGDLWQGEITLIYPDRNGLTAAESQDILKLGRVAGAIGDVSLTLTKVSVGEFGNFDLVDSVLDPDEAVHEIAKLYQIWDLNRDDTVDQRDLNLVLSYYRAASTDDDWDVTDFYGYKPKQADINEDGVVDLVDILAVFVNYTR